MCVCSEAGWNLPGKTYAHWGVFGSPVYIWVGGVSVGYLLIADYANWFAVLSGRCIYQPFVYFTHVGFAIGSVTGLAALFSWVRGVAGGAVCKIRHAFGGATLGFGTKERGCVSRLCGYLRESVCARVG